MSVESRGGARRTGAVRPDATARRGRRPVAPAKVGQSRNWLPIAMFTVVILIAAGIVSFAGWEVWKHNEGARPMEEQVADIDGAVNFRQTDKSLARAGNHTWGPLRYRESPPVGGRHNPNWQNCMGDIYDAPIANEHAVHSMEHGAVWVTYNPEKLSPADVEKLAKKVRARDYLMMSPYPGLDKAISLQAWGFQLKVDSVNDDRIDKFITATRKVATMERGVACSGGITEPGITPRDIGKTGGGMPGQPT